MTARRLQKDGRNLPTLELTFPTATAQLQDLLTDTKLGLTNIRKQISVFAAYIQCHKCLKLRPNKSHDNCIDTCAFCAQKGHTRDTCTYYKDQDLRYRLCTLCGNDHMANHCPKLTTTRTDIMKKRHVKAMAQLEQDAKQEDFLLKQKHCSYTLMKQQPHRKNRKTINQKNAKDEKT
jgi:hypothetical protein